MKATKKSKTGTTATGASSKQTAGAGGSKTNSKDAF